MRLLHHTTHLALFTICSVHAVASYAHPAQPPAPLAECVQDMLLLLHTIHLATASCRLLPALLTQPRPQLHFGHAAECAQNMLLLLLIKLPTLAVRAVRYAHPAQAPAPL
jgi:hypothetical protein